MTARIRIELSDDQMHAWLRVLPGEPLDVSTLATEMASAGVAFGVDAAVVAAMASQLADPSFACERIEIATGRPMQRASEGACELELTVGLQSGRRHADGSFDYRDRGLLTPVERGQVVAHCEPPSAGIEGRTVTGRAIPCERVRDDGLVLGDGLVRQPDGDVVATRDGVLVEATGDALAVGDHYLHSGDVDMRSGHLEMRGSLTVAGNVTAKFEVQASSDLEIGGAVDRGTVYAGGAIRIGGGVIGTGGGVVLAELDVAAEHGQAAVIHCGGTVHLRKGAINCELVAEVVRVDGAVRGGSLRAERAIVVGDAGARLGGETELAVAVPFERPVRALFDEHRRERQLADRLAAQVLRVRRPTRVLPGSPEALAHAERVHALALGAHVDVLGTIHAGSTIAIGAHRLVLDAPQRHCRFSLDPESREIRREPLP